MLRLLLRSLLPAVAGAAVLFSPSPAATRPRPTDLRGVRVADDGARAMIPELGEVKLTLEPRLQRAAQRLLDAAAPPEGAVVVSDVRTGRILAWATRGAASDAASTPAAPSASLFKIVTASTLLERGAVTPETQRCWRGGEHAIEARDLGPAAGRGGQCATVGEALGRSVNLVFGRLAVEHASASSLEAMAASLGFSGPVPIDVAVGASVTSVPSDPLGLARAAAGFWNGKLTPIGALFAMQTIANEGERVRLKLLDRGADRVSAGRAMRPETARALRRMLEGTTRSGTCAKVWRGLDGGRPYVGPSVAAKTGTLVGGAPARMYSWFAGFAPSKQPEIAVAVMLANDLTWRRKANQVGREVFRAWFDRSGAGGSSVRSAQRRRPVARR